MRLGWEGRAEMTDQLQVRRYAFKLYVSKEQDAALHQQAAMMVDLWNALLQRHEDIYRRTRGQRRVVHFESPKRTPSFFDMTTEITTLRQTCPEWAYLSVWSAHRVARSLDYAFDGFYRRAKQGAGAQSGYPRYKKRALANCVPHRFASGCKLTRHGNGRNWKLYLKGIPGLVRARGELPAEALGWADADVIYRDNTWWLSACVEMAPRRKKGRSKLTVRFNLIDEFALVEGAIGRRTASVSGAFAQQNENVTPSQQLER